ncbi:MAG: hypothetical protein COB09_11160 [Thalassobium sp.]|nr:MAG: hypothetical protein COB09_11160 [Thalassobium sp.]
MKASNKKELHEYEQTEKQKQYARYLLTLDAGRRNEMLANMRLPLRTKMRGFIRDAWAEKVAGFESSVKRAYLERLRNTQRQEYNELLPLVAAYEAAAGQKMEKAAC